MVLGAVEGELILRDRVVAQISRAIKAGPVSEPEIAKSLGYSARSLRRALASQGINYRDILSDCRRTMALTYMQDGRSLTEISLILGYNDPPAFTRAFKKWFGMTPTAYRTQHFK